MITLDIVVFFAVLFAIVIALAWFMALPEWRRLITADRLEMRQFLRRQGRKPPEAEVGMPLTRLAELRCAACAAAPDCDRRLAAGCTGPVKRCPNATLFANVRSAS